MPRLTWSGRGGRNGEDTKAFRTCNRVELSRDLSWARVPNVHISIIMREVLTSLGGLARLRRPVPVPPHRWALPLPSWSD